MLAAGRELVGRRLLLLLRIRGLGGHVILAVAVGVEVARPLCACSRWRWNVEDRRRAAILVVEELEVERVAVGVLLERRELDLLVGGVARPLDHEDLVLLLPPGAGALVGLEGALVGLRPLNAEELRLDADDDILHTWQGLQDGDDFIECLCAHKKA